MRLWALLFVLGFTSSVFADVAFQRFRWRGDSRFELAFTSNQVSLDGQPIEIRGDLRDGDRVHKDDQINVDLIAYREGFVVVFAVEPGQEWGQVFILERQNNVFNNITSTPIYARAATMVTDFDAAMSALKSQNGWDPSLALRAMNSWFSFASQKRLSDFLDEVEVGRVRVVAKPPAEPQDPRFAGVRQPGPLPPARADEDPSAYGQAALQGGNDANRPATLDDQDDIEQQRREARRQQQRRAREREEQRRRQPPYGGWGYPSYGGGNWSGSPWGGPFGPNW